MTHADFAGIGRIARFQEIKRVFTDLGVPPRVAWALARAGYADKEAIRAATDEELMTIRMIGRGAVAQIREALGKEVYSVCLLCHGTGRITTAQKEAIEYAEALRRDPSTQSTHPGVSAPERERFTFARTLSDPGRPGEDASPHQDTSPPG